MLEQVCHRTGGTDNLSLKALGLDRESFRFFLQSLLF